MRLLTSTFALVLFLALGCGWGSETSKKTSAPFLYPMSDADLTAFLANQPSLHDSPEFKNHVQFAWDHILGPTAKTRYDRLSKAPCSFSIQEQVHFLKSDELRGDQELDKIHLMYYCAGRERSRKFMQAARVRLRQQYPALSLDEIEILAGEDLEKERARWVLERKLSSPSRGLACTSNRVGGYTYTDCY